MKGSITNKTDSYLMPFMDVDTGGSPGGEPQSTPEPVQPPATVIGGAVNQNQPVTDPAQPEGTESKPPIDMSNPFAAATAGMQGEEQAPTPQPQDIPPVEYEKFTIPEGLGIELAYDEKAFGEFAAVEANSNYRRTRHRRSLIYMHGAKLHTPKRSRINLIRCSLIGRKR